MRGFLYILGFHPNFLGNTSINAFIAVGNSVIKSLLKNSIKLISNIYSNKISLTPLILYLPNTNSCLWGNYKICNLNLSLNTP